MKVCHALLSATLLVASCSSQPVGETWQITDVYTTPGMPSSIPEEVSGAVAISFGSSTISGFTGCARFRGAYTGGPIETATAVEFSDLEFKPIDDSCQGRTRYLHDSLVSMLVDSSFTASHKANNILVLTSAAEDNAIDPPAIRLASSSAPHAATP